MNAINVQSFRRWRLACLLVGLLYFGGCTQTQVYRLAIYAPGNEEKVQPVPESGLYKIKAVGVSKDGVMTIPGTQRFLRQGDPLGFKRTDDGSILAVAGDEMFLVTDAQSVKRLMWYRSAEVPNVALYDFGDTVLEAAKITAGVILIGALLYAEAALDHDHHNDWGDDDEDSRSGDSRHHDRGHSRRSADNPNPGGVKAR